MTKKIKFPLEMDKGVLVRELEEFQDHFHLEKAVEYFCNGRLQKWLENTYNDDILAEIESLTGQEEDFVERFTDILGVEYEAEEATDVQTIIRNAVLKEKLKRFFTEEEATRLAGTTAETQQDLERLAREGETHIYLLSGTFQIPGNMREITLEGIDSAKVAFEETDSKKFQEQRLHFRNLLPADERSEELMRQKNGWEGLTLELLDVLELFLEQA